MAIVADASPLIIFARGRLLELLRALFAEVWVPPTVASEAYLGDPARPGAMALAAAAESWLRVVSLRGGPPSSMLGIGLDPGELEAIALAREHGLALLIDDRDGRAAAERVGVNIFGSGGVLVRAKRGGLISAVRPVLDELALQGLWLSAGVRRRILLRAGETGE